MSTRVDLIDQPWIPCELAGGGSTAMGLLDVLGRAHEIRAIRGDIATQDFALTRLLLAVLHSALRGPATVADWRDLWMADALPSGRIAAYLDEHRDRFDLLHPRTPFFQIAELRTVKDETFGVERLVADLPTGASMFAQRRGQVQLGVAEAARWLVHAHACDVAGIKSGAVGDPRVRGGKTYPIGPGWAGRLGGWLVQGATLRETLLLNLGAADHGPWARDPDLDLPVWERAPHGPAQEQPGRAPTGPVDLYTWQSRRIRLVADDGGEHIVGVLVAHGDELEPDDGHRVEPHTVWRANPPRTTSAPVVHAPQVHRADRPAWRALPALLPPSHDAGGPGPATAEVVLHRPGVAEWVGHLIDAGALPDRTRVVLRAVGLIFGVQRAVIEDIVDDQLIIPAGALAPGIVADVVADGLASVEAAVRAVGNLAGDLVAAAGGDSDGPRDRTRAEVRWDLAPRVRSWLSGMHPDVDPGQALGSIHRAVLDEVAPVANDLLDHLPRGVWQGREVRGQVLTAAHAESRYRTALRAALPLAFESTAELTDDDRRMIAERRARRAAQMAQVTVGPHARR